MDKRMGDKEFPSATACAVALNTLCASKVDELELEGRICYGGLDLSSTTDITAFVLVFPLTEDDDRYIVKPWCWRPPILTLCFHLTLTPQICIQV